MEALTKGIGTKESALPIFTTLNTTLYDLIKVIDEEVEPANDRLFVEILSDLLDRGLMRFPNSLEKSVQDDSFN